MWGTERRFGWGFLWLGKFPRVSVGYGNPTYLVNPVETIRMYMLEAQVKARAERQKVCFEVSSVVLVDH